MISFWYQCVCPTTIQPIQTNFYWFALRRGLFSPFNSISLSKHLQCAAEAKTKSRWILDNKRNRFVLSSYFQLFVSRRNINWIFAISSYVPPLFLLRNVFLRLFHIYFDVWSDDSISRVIHVYRKSLLINWISNFSACPEAILLQICISSIISFIVCCFLSTVGNQMKII